MFYAFARSGGTLTNQLLSCCPGVLIASEVSVNESALPLGFQLHHWHQLISTDEASDIDSMPYLDQMKAAANIVAKHGKELCVRDWPVVHFLPGLRRGQQPSRILESWDYLHSAGWEIKGLAVIRRSHEVYLSMRKYLGQFFALGEDEFYKGCEAYIREINRTGVPKFYLEGIRSSPLKSTQLMADALGLSEPDSIEGFHEYQACTGNNTLRSKPASASLTSVGAPEKALPAPEMFQELDRLACYE